MYHILLLLVAAIFEMRAKITGVNKKDGPLNKCRMHSVMQPILQAVSSRLWFLMNPTPMSLLTMVPNLSSHSDGNQNWNQPRQLAKLTHRLVLLSPTNFARLMLTVWNGLLMLTVLCVSLIKRKLYPWKFSIDGATYRCHFLYLAKNSSLLKAYFV